MDKQGYVLQADRKGKVGARLELLTEAERRLVEGLRSNYEAGQSGDTLEREEIAALLAVLDRLAPTPL